MLSIEYDTLVLGPEDDVYLATADRDCHDVTLGLYRNRSAYGIKGNQATFDNSQRNNLRSFLWGFSFC